MGVCGTAMGNLAVLMKQLGHEVSGADANVYPPMSTFLDRAGIDILSGFDPARLARLSPQRVVIGNAMSRGNPEVEFLLRSRSIPFTSLPDLIGTELIRERKSVVITGTHGKTTTTAITAFLLKSCSTRPGWIIGGLPADLPSGAELGHQDSPFVIEGDEYDSAFFDKRSKFIHYRPTILVINNLEFDHADIFRDLDDVKRSFKHLTRLVPDNGCILYNGDDPNLRDLLPVPWCPCFSVGTAPENDLSISGFKESEKFSSFVLRWKGAIWGKVSWRQSGLYNARNAAMGAMAAAMAIRPNDPFCALDLGPLSEFNGVKRRQEVLLHSGSLTVVEDFAHHPTAVGLVLQALRARFPNHRLTACFEARSNTARRKLYTEGFANALAKADAVYVAPLENPEKFDPEIRLDPNQLATRIRTLNPSIEASACDSIETMLQTLIDRTPPPAPTVIVFFSNGSFGGMIQSFVKHAHASPDTSD